MTVKYCLKHPSKIFSELWYWFRCHTFTRYHMIDCRSPQNDYKWGWCDKDNLMFYACFNLLKSYIEEENPRKFIAWDYDEETKAQWNEIEELYNWWASGRKAEHDACSELYKSINYIIPESANEKKETYSMEEVFGAPDNEAAHEQWLVEYHRLDDKDDEMFDRLMKIRKILWT